MYMHTLLTPLLIQLENNKHRPFILSQLCRIHNTLYPIQTTIKALVALMTYITISKYSTSSTALREAVKALSHLSTVIIV